MLFQKGFYFFFLKDPALSFRMFSKFFFMVSLASTPLSWLRPEVCRLFAIVNSSRGIIAAWKNEAYKEFADGRVGEAARAAALDMKTDIESALKA